MFFKIGVLKNFAIFSEVKHQNNVDVVLGLCCLSLNFKLLPFASIFFVTLSKYFVDWFNFANINTIVLAFITNSRVED